LVTGPPAHFSWIVRPSRPVIARRRIEPVIASKPVAKTTASTATVSWPVTTPSGTKPVIGAACRSTRVTFGRLKVSK
jgi:hypothetical protein